jgi:hypothetical protein
MKLILLSLLLPLATSSSLLLRHQSELTTTTTTTTTAILAIDSKQKQLSDRAPDIEQETNHETNAGNAPNAAQSANQELTDAVMASLPNATNGTNNNTTSNDDWKLLEDGLRSKHLLDNMEATAPALQATDHWKTVPTTWAQALKTVHPKSAIDLTESELKEVANSSSYYRPPSNILVNYTYGQSTTGQMLSSTEMNVSHLVKDINAAAGSDYFQTERKTKGMDEEVDTHTNDLLQNALKTALDESLPPNIFDETMDESLLEVENNK